jgi:hypothetical protein
MRHACTAAVIGLMFGCSGGSDPAPLVTSTCDMAGSAQCAVYTVPADWPVDVRANCETAGGSWNVPCPELGRVGTCTCAGSGGISTLVYSYDVPWRTAAQAEASCVELGCAWTAP